MGNNLELQNAYKSPDIATGIKIRGWIGRGMSKWKTRVIRDTKPEGRHGVGRPELRWLDHVDTDRTTLGL